MAPERSNYHALVTRWHHHTEIINQSNQSRHVAAHCLYSSRGNRQTIEALFRLRHSNILWMSHPPSILSRRSSR